MAEDPLMAALVRFNVNRSGWLRTAVAGAPAVLGMLLLADWLIGRSVFAGDLFRLTAVLTIAVELIVARTLFEKVPEAMLTLWARGLIGDSKDSQPTSQAYLGLIREFEQALNRRLAWLVGVILAIAGLGATYPVRYWIATGHSPFNPAQLASYYLFGNAAIVVAPLGYLVGLLAWRVGVIAFFITRLGERFELKIQPRHPDQGGGLKPLGDLCFMIALLLLVPAFYLSGWGLATTFFKIEGLEVYTVLWSGLFRKTLVVLSVSALFLFLRPLYRVHRQMENRRRAIQADLDELSRKIDDILLELRTKAETLAPEQGARRLEDLKFLEKVYEETRRVPTWPFDSSTFTRFVAAQAVPVLSLTGTAGPIIKILEGLMPFLSR